MIGIVAPVLAFEEFAEASDHRVQSLCFHPAGQGVNVARAVRELGEECTIVGCNGGESGIIMRALLDAYGLAHRLVPVHGETAAVLTVTSGHAEQETFRLMPPAISRHEADDLYTAASLLIMECSIVVLATNLLPGMPPDFFERLVRLANRYRVRTVVDLPPPVLPAVLGAEPTIIKPGLHQLREFYPVDGDPTPGDLLAVADDLLARGARAAAISLGEAGAILAEPDGAWRLVSPAVEPVVEAGAGDCMAGGIAVGICRGQSILDAVRLGAAAGSAKVMRHGLGTCKRDVTRQLFERVRVERLR